MHAEIVYETGRVSVGQYDDEKQLKEALKNHNDRAKNGEVGGPIGAPAERIAAVYLYDKFPGNFNPDQTMSAEVLNKELSALVKASADDNDVVAIDQLVNKVRGLSHPMNEKVSGFDSRFKMKESGKLDLAFLDAEGAAK